MENENKPNVSDKKHFVLKFDRFSVMDFPIRLAV